MPDLTPTPPLTTLSEEEELFRRTVRDFAERTVRPRVAAMERAAALDPALLTQCFELGLMGIEIPETHGGAGGSTLMTVLAVEELSAVDASLAIFVDVQNTLVNTLLMKWASDDIRSRYLPRLATTCSAPTRCPSPIRVRTRSGCRRVPRGPATSGFSRGGSSGSPTGPRRACS